MAYEFAALAVRIGANIQDLQSNLAKATGQIKGFADKNSNTIRALGTTFAVTGAAITGSIALMVRSASQYADQMNEVHKRTGVAVETLGRLKYVADQTESSFEAVAMGLKFLNKNLYDASRGNQNLVATFSRLGIQVRDASGKIRNADEVLLEASDRFKEMENDAEKTAVAMQLFGKSGETILPILNLGSQEIERLSKEAERLGMVLTEDNIKQFDEFSDALKETKSALTGLYIALSTTILPTLKELIGFTTDVISDFNKWAKENPVLAKSIMSIAIAIGVLNLAIGTSLLSLKNFSTVFNFLATEAFFLPMRIQGIALAIKGLGASAVIAAGGLAPLMLALMEFAVAAKILTEFTQAIFNLIEAQRGLKNAQEQLDNSYSTFMTVVENSKKIWDDLSEAEQKRVNKLERLINVYDELRKQGKLDEEQKKRLQKLILEEGKAVGALNAQHKEYLDMITLKIARSQEYLDKYREIQGQLNELVMQDEELREWKHEQDVIRMKESIAQLQNASDAEKQLLLQKVEEYDEAFHKSTKAAGGALLEYNKAVEKVGAGYLKIQGDAKDVFGEMPNIITDAALSMKSTLGEVFFDSFNNNLKNARDYFQSFTESIKRSFANMLADMVARALWAKAVAGIMSIFGMGTGTSSTGVISEAGAVSSATSTAPVATGMAHAQSGMEYVPKDGPVYVHRGEEIKSKDEARQGKAITIINLFDKGLVPAIMANEGKGVIVNVVNENMMRSGSIRKTFMTEGK
jgi:hypothetical protein